MAAFFAAAMSLVGFAHSWPRAQDVDLAEFALPDGTLPVICSVHGSESPSPSDPPSTVCEACLLKTGVTLDLSGAKDVGRVQSGLLIRVAYVAVLPRSLDRRGERQARAPPSLIL